VLSDDESVESLSPVGGRLTGSVGERWKNGVFDAGRGMARHPNLKINLKLADAFNRIDAAHIPYGFLGPNSNPVVPYATEANLYFYRARYYGPSDGRFLSEDPIQFASGIDFYAFVSNRPQNFADPLGLSPNDVNRILNRASSGPTPGNRRRQQSGWQRRLKRNHEPFSLRGVP
jgi:RHS repeat-associated protein